MKIFSKNLVKNGKEKTHYCDVCTKGYSNLTFFLHHIEHAHKIQRDWMRYQCRTCLKRFMTIGTFRRLAKRKHFNPNTFEEDDTDYDLVFECK